MARPYKQGIDYFPFDVDLMADRKLRKPKEKYGCLATAVYIELLCLIYKDKGYYIDYSEENREDVQLDILDCLRGKHQPTKEYIGEVIADLVAVGLFSTELWDQNIISSHRLQCTYYRAVLDRKNVSIDWSKWLLTEEEMRELGSSCIILKNFINRSKNDVNPTNNPVNPPKKTQSKVKESKEKKSKEDGALAAPTYFASPDVNQLFLDYLEQRKASKLSVSKRTIAMLQKKLDGFSIQEQKQALEDAIIGNYKSLYPKKTVSSETMLGPGEIPISEERKQAYYELDALDEATLWEEIDNAKM